MASEQVVFLVALIGVVTVVLALSRAKKPAKVKGGATGPPKARHPARAHARRK